MNYFYKLPTKFEDTNPIHYINLTNIQSISMITEVIPDTTGGTIKRACLIVNGIKYVYDSVHFSGITVVGDNKAQTIEYEKTNTELEVEFTCIMTRLNLIIHDIMEKAQRCHQKSNEIEIEKPKMLEKAEKREYNAKEIVKKIEEYCECKLVNFYGEKDEVALAGLHELMAILEIIHPDENIRNKIKQKFELNNQSLQDGLDTLR